MGLMLAEPGYHTRAFVEWEDWPRAVLIAAQRAGYFAPAPIWTDLRSFDARPFRGAFDIVLAGYPCQPFSAAGKRGGADDPRHLWPDVARVIGECRPEWVFLENVAGHVTLGLETVLRELWGWATRLRRVCSRRQKSARRTSGCGSSSWPTPMSLHPGTASYNPAGNSDFTRKAEALALGITSWSTPEGDGWREGRAGPELWLGRDAAPARAGGAMADASRAELEGQLGGQHHPHRWQVPDGHPALPGGAGLHPPGPGDHDAWRAVLAARPDLAPALGFDDCLAWARRLAADPEGPVAAAAEPALRRMADGLAHRARALRLLGNGVHPLAAAHAWRSLAAAHGLGPVDLAADGPGPAPGADGFP
jgi:DNA (cytosine-5)-methyltransferase 1